jgi:hypothetical protein
MKNWDLKEEQFRVWYLKIEQLVRVRRARGHGDNTPDIVLKSTYFLQAIE